MIDLREKGLPTEIKVGNSFFTIKTDFREWLKFEEKLKSNEIEFQDIADLFVDTIPISTWIMYKDDILNELQEFLVNKNATPRTSEDDNGENVFDYILDGEYIVGSFMSAYGIDLTTADMHWHLFKALFLSLPDNSKIKQIMSMRAYKKSNESYDQTSSKLKEAWMLPDMTDDELNELEEEISSLFYNA